MEVGLYIIKIGSTGITWIDVLLTCLCPIAGFLGAKVGSIMQIKQIRKALPKEEYIRKGWAELGENPEFIHPSVRKEIGATYDKYIFDEVKSSTQGNLLIGMALGFVVSLYFFGAINQDMTSVARVVGLCVLLGYQAPNLWNLQEKVISDIVEKKLTEVIGAGKDNSRKLR